eukprot:955189-Pyramimonas_sp.AAC.1
MPPGEIFGQEEQRRRGASEGGRARSSGGHRHLDPGGIWQTRASPHMESANTQFRKVGRRGRPPI